MRTPKLSSPWLSTSLLAGLLLVALAEGATAGPVQLLSRTAEPGLRSATANGTSRTAVGSTISADGRYLVFDSDALNLVPGQSDNLGKGQVFLFDRVTGNRTLLSHAVGNPTRPASGYSSGEMISADGRFIAFGSDAADLIPGVSGGQAYLYDRPTGFLTLISHRYDAATAAGNRQAYPYAISADGRFVAFTSEATDLVAGQVAATPTGNVFLYDRTTGSSVLVSHRHDAPATSADQPSSSPVLSADGAYMAYFSPATDLVAGQSTTDVNVFLFERATGTNVLVSHRSDAATAGGNAPSLQPSVSADGAYVAYLSLATDLVAGGRYPVAQNIFLYSRLSGTNRLVSHAAGSPTEGGNSYSSSFSPRKAGPSISADGSYVAYGTMAGNLITPGDTPYPDGQVILWSRWNDQNVLVSRRASSPLLPGSGGSYDPLLSGDGRWVSFGSNAPDLLPTPAGGSGQLFLYDGASEAVSLISHAAGGTNTPADGSSFWAAFSADGGTVAYTTAADDLVAGQLDANQNPDVALYRRASQQNQWVSLAAFSGATAGGESVPVAMSHDGSVILFTSLAPDLVPGQQTPHGGEQLFRYSRQSSTLSLVSHAIGLPTTTANGGITHSGMSADGRFTVVASAATDLYGIFPSGEGNENVYLYDHEIGVMALVSHAAQSPVLAAYGSSTWPAISDSGNFVAFVSDASDFMPGEVASNHPNVFLWERRSGTVTLVSHADGAPLVPSTAVLEAPGISADGRFVLFLSPATGLSPGQIDANQGNDVFLYDRRTGGNTLVSHAAGTPDRAANAPTLRARLSADGSSVAFWTAATDVVAGQGASPFPQVFLWDRATDTTRLVSHAAGAPLVPADDATLGFDLSADGSVLALSGYATNLVEGEATNGGHLPQVFVYDRETDAFSLASHPSGSPLRPTSSFSLDPVVSADGSHVLFRSAAPDLLSPAAGSPDGVYNLFLYDRASGENALVSHTEAAAGTGGNGSSGAYDSLGTFQGGYLLSADAAWVAFASQASDLVAEDVNRQGDAFLFASDLPGRQFYTLVPPCRLLDTRQSAQGPALLSGVTAELVAHGACGIPVGARALAANVFVTAPTGAGFLTLFPGDIEKPLASHLNFGPGQTRANNAIVPLALDGSGVLAIFPAVGGQGTVHVVIDVTGYFE